VRNFFNGKLFYKLLSVVLAVFFWFYINNLQDPITIKTYRVPLTLTDMRDGLVLDQGPDTVDVRAEGVSSAMNQLTAADFLASVNLSDAGRGAAVYPVQVTPPEGARLLNDRQLSVELVLDEINMVTLPVQAAPVNAPPFGYSNLEPVVTPSEVQVQGRMKILEKLSRGQAYYNLEGAREGFSTEAPVTLIDADGEEVPAENLVILPSQVQIQVPVTEVISTREIPVHLMISGMLQTESLIRTVTIEPESVTATGPQEMLSALEEINTETMDVSGIMATGEFYIPLAVPEGIQSLSADAVRVSVSVEPVMGTKNFEDISVEIQNVPIGAYVAYTDNMIRTVTARVGGTVDALSQLEKNGVRAFLDLTDLPPGAHTVGVTVQAPEGFTVEEITPAQVEVVLSRN
jgi:YbbR domain-containing protein